MELDEYLGYTESKPDQVKTSNQSNDLGKYLGYDEPTDQEKPSVEQSIKSDLRGVVSDYMLDKVAPEVKKAQDWGNAALMGVYDAIGDIGRIGSKLIDKATGTEFEKGFKQHVKNVEQSYEASNTPGTSLARFAGMMGAPLGVIGKGIKGASALANIGRGVAVGGGAGLAGYKEGGEETLAKYAIPAGIGAVTGGALGGATSALGSYLGRATQLGVERAKTPSIPVFNIDVTQSKLGKFTTDTVLSNIPVVGTAGARVKQREAIGEALEGLVNKIATKARNVESRGGDANTIVRKALQSSMKTINGTEKRLWKPLNERGKDIAIGDGKKAIKNMFSDHDAYIGGKLRRDLNQLLKADEPLTFKRAKEIRTYLRTQKEKAFGGEFETQLAREALDDMYGRFTSILKKSAEDAGLGKQFARANRYTRIKHDMNYADLEKAAMDQKDTQKFVKSLISQQDPDVVKSITAAVRKKDKPAVFAGSLRQIMNNSLDESNNFRLSTFIKLTKDQQLTPLMDNKTFKAMEGIQKMAERNMAAYGERVGRSTGKGSLSPEIIGAGIGSAVLGGVGVTGGVAPAVAVAATPAILSFIAAKSPIKTLLIKLGMASPDSKLIPYLTRKVQIEAGKVGIVASQEGNEFLLDKK